MPAQSPDPNNTAVSPDPAESSAAAAFKLARTKKRLDVNPELILAEGRNKRRRTPTPDPNGDDAKPDVEMEPVMTEAERLEARYKARNDGDSMIKSIRAFKNKEGRVLSLMFLQLPDPKLYQGYYLQIKHPKSIFQIEARLKLTPRAYGDSPATGKKPRAVDKGKEGEYEGYNDLAEVRHDLDIVFNNCKRYNVKEAIIFQDARKLHKLAKDLYPSFTVERESSPEPEAEPEPEPEAEREPEVGTVDGGTKSKKKRKAEPEEAVVAGESGAESKPRARDKPPTVYKQAKAAMKKLDGVVGPEGTRSCDFFEELPSRKDWADYYNLINRPISLTEINAKIKDKQYTSLGQWEADVKLMCGNAKQYNIEESDVFKDAVVLENALPGIMADVTPKTKPLDTESPSTAHAIPKIKLNLGHKSVTPVPHIPAAPPPLPTSAAANDSAMKVEPEPSVPAPSPAPASLPSLPVPPPAPPPRVVEPPRPPLPANAVTQYIIRLLDTYTTEEKQAWVAMMDPPVIQEMRRLLNLNNGTEPPAGTGPAQNGHAISGPHGDVDMDAGDIQNNNLIAPSSNLVRPPSPAPPTIDPVIVPKRPLPSLPLIRYFDFTYDVLGGAAGSNIRKKTVKLRNLRGVVSHSIAVRHGTRQLEVSAYLEEGFFNLKPLQPGETVENRSEVKAGLVPISASTGYAPLPECNMNANGHHVPGALLYPGDDIAERPIGNKWTIPFPPERGNLVLEITVHRPAELTRGLPGNRDVAVREICMIFVARQT